MENGNLTPLRRLQLCELEILNRFVEICEKYDLRYFLVGGTLLGAVRHKGFIPWDDDIDVAMLREDYDKFAKIAQIELGDTYFYQDYYTDPHYFLSYAKIRKNGTEVYEERFKDSKFHKGVFIDIFPLDYCPKPGLLSHFIFNVLAVMNYRGQVDSGEIYQPYEEWIGKIGYGFLKVFRAKQLMKFREKIILAACNFSDNKYVASYSGAYGYGREIFLSKYYHDVSYVEFEQLTYTAPSSPNAQLVLTYGADYLQLPPDGNKRTHIDIENSRFEEVFSGV